MRIIDQLDFIEDPEDSRMLFGKDELYIVTADLEQNEQKDIKRFDGSTVTLYTPQKYNPNYRTALPRVGKIVRAIGEDCKFKVGQELIMDHFSLIDENRQSRHFIEEDGIKYYLITNLNILAGIVEGELVPQDEVIIAEPIVAKLIDTTLELSDEYIDVRRDVVKTLIVPDKYKDTYKPGEYLFLNEGGDYHFDFKGKTYIAVELFLDGVAMYGPTLDYKPAVLWRHKTDHGEETDITK